MYSFRYLTTTMKVAFCLLLAVAVAQATVYCPPDVCDNPKCENPGLKVSDCGPKRFEPKGGRCGCCPICITQLKFGEDCSETLRLGAVKTSECEGNLKCNRTTEKCDYRCFDELASSQVKVMAGRFIPRCEQDGSYSPYQCQGSECYCVAKDGTQIDGYNVDRWKVAGMNCKCARDKYEYSKLKIIGKFFYCASNGNYEKVQCEGSVCFCADENGQIMPGARQVPIADHYSLKCDDVIMQQLQRQEL